MSRLILHFLLLSIIFCCVCCSPYRSNSYYSQPQNRSYDQSYRDRGSYRSSRRYSGRRSRYRTTTPSYQYDSFDSHLYNYDSHPVYSEYGYPKYSPYEKQKEDIVRPQKKANSFFSFLPDIIPSSFKSYVDQTVNQAKDVVEDIIKSQEETVVGFFNETIQQGEQIATSLLNELEREIKNKTEDNKHAFINALSDFEDKLFSGPNKMINIWDNETTFGSSANSTAEDLAVLKRKFAEFENKVETEVEQEKKLPSELKNQLLKFITAGRQAMKEISSEEEAFWEKLKQMEKEVYQFKLDLADSSEGLKDKLNSLLDSLQKVEFPDLDNLEEDIVYKEKPKTLGWLTSLFSSPEQPSYGPPPQYPYPPPPNYHGYGSNLFPSYNSSTPQYPYQYSPPNYYYNSSWMG